MNPFEKIFDVDLEQGIKKPIDLGTLIFEGDNNAYKIGSRVFKGKTPVPITGAIVGNAIRHDGSTIVINGSISDNIGYIILPQAVGAYPGPIEISIKNFDGTDIETIGSFTAKAKRTQTGTTIDPGHVVPGVEEVVALITETTDAKNAAISAAAEARTAAEETAQLVREECEEFADSASESAAAAQNAAQNAASFAFRSVRYDADESTSRTAIEKDTARKNIGAAAEEDMDEAIESLAQANAQLAGMVNGGFVENNALYLTHDGVVVAGPFEGIGGGGSGGGSGSGAVMTMTNQMDWLATTIAGGAECPITVAWSSLMDEVPTGNGTLRVMVNDSIRAVLNVAQGNVTVDVGEYLRAGANTVRLTITDMYGGQRTIAYTVTSVTLSLSSSFDTSVAYDDAFLFYYTPVGSVEKTVHFKLDGTEMPAYTTSVSNRQLSYAIPAQTHGAHTLEAWFTATIDEETVESNRLRYEFMAVEEGETDPIIIANYSVNEVKQYDAVAISYMVYTPGAAESEVEIYENDTLITAVTVGRTPQPYTYRANQSGSNTLTFISGSAELELDFTVTAQDIHVEAETDGLLLYLSAKGRSNAEANPDTWVSGNIEAEFSGFTFTSDGWQKDEEGADVLRLSGDARLTIPYQIFAQDIRTTGRTIEIEFATRDTRNYDSTILSCVSGGRGITMTAQAAQLASEQSAISTQYKEDEHVRVGFVVQKRSDHRLMFIYLNGVVSGVVQYPENDDFSQVTPVDISLGGSDATMDVYCIRVYDHDLTSQQMEDNWIADSATGAQLVDRYRHNNIRDEYGNIVIAKLPSDLPYMILTGVLPTYKGNKLSISGEYVDPVHPEKSFTFENAIIDVQGTSSQYYARKNYKVKFDGFTSSSGTTASKYAMNADAVPTKTFTFKADVASSEGANNVELARLYNDICPYKTPYQIANSKVRQGIDGFPMVIFHNDGTDTVFLGKYNFNNDKGTEEVFGFSDGDESWEILNNTSNRVLWKSDDYTGDDWLNDFEARYPEDNTNPVNLKALATWLKSTDQTQATGDALAESVTYTDGEGQDAVTTTYTNDTAAYRLAKFRHEIEDWMELDSILFYYLFTELFLMVDSRAKNAFPSKLGGDKWCILPYDFDTALGINNEGALIFSYNLEDTDHLSGGADIFNGQQSVLWVNLRQAFFSELKAMYQELRSNNKLSYAKVEGMFEAHQDKWPEAIFNEDAQYKYLDPLINDNDGSYLGMLQGSKEEQRKWWLYNRFRYIDSKYNAGDALTDVIQVRGYAKADITVTPYADIYPAVKYGSYLVSSRGQRNVPMTLTNPLDNVNDTEIYIYSASQLANVGDLSGLKVGFADFSKAIKLQNLKIGDSAAGYTNGNLTELYLGNNTLLKTIDVRNCTALSQAVDLRGCVALENVYFDGTAITGVQLPNGGVVKTLHLPGTITNLTILNQTGITDFVCPDYSHITTLRLENVPDTVDAFEIVNDMAAGSRVRLYNFHWELTDIDDLIALYDKLDTMRGMDQNGNNTQTAQLYGTVHIPAVTGAELAELGDRYPDVTVTYDSITSSLYYYSFDGNTLLHTETIANGGNGRWQDTPAKPSDTAQYTFGAFQGWSLTKESDTATANATRNVTADRNVYAAFSYALRTYTATFMRDSTHGGGTLYTQQNVPYGTTPTYGGAEPTSTLGDDYAFDGWNPALSSITGNTTYYAVFRDMVIPLYKYLKRSITEYESDNVTAIGKYAFQGMTTLETVKASASLIDEYAFTGCTALTEVDLTNAGSTDIRQQAFSGCTNLKRVIIRSGSVASLANYNAFNDIGRALIYVPDNLVSTYKSTSPWNNSAIVNRIYGISDMYTYEWNEIEIPDDDATLFAAINNGTAANTYKPGMYRTLDLGSEGVIRMQIAAVNVRELANSTDKAQLEWVAMEALKTMHRMNPQLSGTTEGTGTIGGFDKSEMKTYLDETIWPLIPAAWRNMIKETKIDTTIYNTSGTKVANEVTTTKLRIPSYHEVFGSTSYETSGPVYSDLFADNATRIRRTTGTSSAVIWWLRSADFTSTFQRVGNSGISSGSNAQSANSVVLGFST